MNRKTYGVETVLHKKRNRPFPKEVVKEVEAGEDLFSALCASKIKEIKHKAKNEEHKKKKKKKKTRALPPLEVLRECSSKENLMDSFDALVIAPRNKAENAHSDCSELHLFGRLTNISVRNKDSRVQDDTLKENSKETCENLQDNSLTHGTKKVNEMLSASKKESIFSKQSPKNGKLSCMPNLNDSDLALLDDSQELECLTNDFITGKINIRGLKKEEPSSEHRKDKILLPTNSNEVLSDWISSEEEEGKNKKEKDNLNDCENSSDEFFSVCRGRKKITCKPVNSTPASCRHLEHDCVLSPILPSLPQCSISNGESTEKAENYVAKLALESQSLPFPRVQSPDPFSASGDKKVFNNFESSSSVAVHDRADGCSPAWRETSLAGRNTVNILNIDSQRHLNSVELDQNGSVLVLLKKSEAKIADKLQFSRTPNYELPPVLQRSSLLEPSIRKLAVSFSRRSSHVVLPLAQGDNLHKISGFREVYTSSCVIRPTLLDCNAIGESSLDEKRNEEITFKDVVLDLCEQTDVLHFLKVFSDCDFAESKKIGEGVYGEVFSHTNSGGISSVMKIMPIEGSCEINGEPQKKYEEILPEIVITRELSNLRTNENFGTSNFPKLIRCWCVQGPYPSKLLKLWHEFAEEKGSENDSPEILAEDQIYIILELSNVGSAMEGFTFSSTSQALSAFMQVTNALAAAEAALEFEHRDLHWGNILIKKTKKRSLPSKLYGEEHNLQTFGIQATVIDFTLSRITYDGCCIYNNLAHDPALFEGQDDYQFDIYRLMRTQTENNWEVFKPYNNVLWLSYVLEKLISGVKYKKPSAKAHKKGMIKLQQLRKKITDFESAVDVALSFMKK